MQRVLVIGSSGAGKSTFALALGAATGLPVIHIDHLFWQAGWVQTPNDVYVASIKAAVAGERWIMDGINTATFDLRVPRADTIIWLQRSRVACVRRVLYRVLKTYGTVRPDMAPGCPEKFDWSFLKWVWNFPRDWDPKIKVGLDRNDAWRRTVILRSDAEAAAYLRQHSRQQDCPAAALTVRG
jgi:adenylate kinase family enzyme